MKKVVNAFIIYQDTILLVQRTPDSDEPNMWSLPWWTVESGEDIITALKRELTEELWLQSFWIIELFKVVAFNEGVEANYFFVHLETCPAISLQTEELSDFKWLPFESFPEKLAFKQEQFAKEAKLLLEARKIV
jgi:ADP-ribose pyrophosphatase YjhB (NUDIX family)